MLGTREGRDRGWGGDTLEALVDEWRKREGRRSKERRREFEGEIKRER